MIQRDQFSRDFITDPIGAVNRIVAKAKPIDAAIILLPYLAMRCSYAQRNLVFNAFLEFASRKCVMDAAQIVYSSSHDERVLGVAADLMEHLV